MSEAHALLCVTVSAAGPLARLGPQQRPGRYPGSGKLAAAGPSSTTRREGQAKLSWLACCFCRMKAWTWSSDTLPSKTHELEDQPGGCEETFIVAAAGGSVTGTSGPGRAPKGSTGTYVAISGTELQ